MFDGQFTVESIRQELLSELRKPQPNWDFRQSENCAIGIVRRLIGKDIIFSNEVATRLGIPGYGHLFVTPYTYKVNHFDRVTPTMVADKLEHIFRSHPIA